MRVLTKSYSKVLEVIGWTLLAFLFASAMRSIQPHPLLNDSYQYLNVAENFKQGQGITTSLIEFDTERSHGRIPALFTTFPPIYPVLIAFLSGFTGNIEGAARLVACVSYTATAALLLWALILMEVPVLLRQVVLLLFVTNAVALSFATVVLTEPLFMLVSTAAVVALIWVEKASPTGHVMVARAVIAYTIAGLACWVRYAGFFLIAAVCAYALLQFILERTRIRLILLGTAVIPILFAGAIMLRNLLTVGTWKGGNDMAVSHPLSGLIIAYFRAQQYLLFGEHTFKFGAWEGLFLVAGIALAAILFFAFWKGSSPNPGRQWLAGWWKPNGPALLVVLCVSIYTVAMFYSGLYTMIDFDLRMFVPILSLYLLLLGIGIKWVTSQRPAVVQSRWLKAGLAMLCVGYIGINARDLSVHRLPSPDAMLAVKYAEPTVDGQSLLKWVDTNIPAESVIAAANGQATGYLLHYPTLSLVEAKYSPVRWECDEVQKQMKRFGANYLILYKPSAAFTKDPLLTESQFVATSATQNPSCGFVVAAENADVRILETEGTQTTARR